jgi:hypothetical protein
LLVAKPTPMSVCELLAGEVYIWCVRYHCLMSCRGSSNDEIVEAVVTIRQWRW